MNTRSVGPRSLVTTGDAFTIVRASTAVHTREPLAHSNADTSLPAATITVRCSTSIAGVDHDSNAQGAIAADHTGVPLA